MLMYLFLLASVIISLTEAAALMRFMFIIVQVSSGVQVPSGVQSVGD